VDQPVTNRRRDARFPPPDISSTRATLRPGCIVFLVDVSAGGALVEAFRPLRPGARVHLQMAAGTRARPLTAHVLRCAVWSLNSIDGVVYRGALEFEHRCEWPWRQDSLSSGLRTDDPERAWARDSPDLREDPR
jgi:hypothetical protein